MGKTYIGRMLSQKLNWHFFDADILYDDELKHLLRSGLYTQDIRDKFVDRLIATTESLLAEGDKNLLIAEAFTKEKNRHEFLEHFDEQVCYIMVGASKDTAEVRMKERLTKGEHVVDEAVFKYVWDEFEEPTIRYRRLMNEKATDKELCEKFKDIIESVQKEER